MSKIALTPNASGSGTFTIASPNSNTDRSLTLPDGAGTLDRLERAGNVLQVVGANDIITATNSNSTSFVATTLAATITPTSASSKILVAATFSATQDGGSNIQSHVTIYRGTTNLRSSGTCNFMYDHPGGNVGFSGTYMVYDSPATTSATTYTVYIKVADSSSFFRAIAGTDTITLMEIAG